MNNLKIGNQLKLIFDNKIERILILDDSRRIYSNEEYDITIIELKENEFDLNDYLKIDDDIFNVNELNETYKNKPIYIIHYLKGKEVNFSIDNIINIDKYNLFHCCTTGDGSSGSPILNLNTFQVIGIHVGKDKNSNCNIGKLIKFSIEDFNKDINKMKNIEPEEVKGISKIGAKTGKSSVEFFEKEQIEDNLIYLNDTINVKSSFSSFINSSRIVEHQNKNILEKNISNNKFINSKIIEKEITNLFEKYPPLDDGITLEIRERVEYENKAIYYGEWEKIGNKRHGRGIQVWEDNNRYEGYWKEDRANVKGKFTYSDGDIYEGEWLKDRPYGYGVYIRKDGPKYEGFWKEDTLEGLGKESWPDGAIYEGNYKKKKKNGQGKYKWKDGSTYYGQFENNNINGKGIYTGSDKRQYIGDWKNNKFDGHGVFTWPDGRKYQGEYKDNKKNGYGIFEWSNGKKYKGNWLNGKQNGEGEFYNKQTRKKCLYKNGKRLKWLDE